MPRSSSRLPAPPGERDLIASLRARAVASHASRRLGSKLRTPGAPRVILGIGDDCAILDVPRGHQILVTTDFSLETIHFRREWHSPESVGHRCLARGLSDLAAMGAQPIAAFLSLALPAELLRGRRGHPSWRDRFFDGLLALAARYSVPLAGGDTAQSPLLPDAQKSKTGLALADIVLIGGAPRSRALRRSAAKPGDRIYVTGYLGGAAAELARLAANPRPFRHTTSSQPHDPNPHPHLFPEPKLAAGAWLLRNRRASAAIDISDGLSTDLDHVCQESNLAADIQAEALPIHPLASLDQALHGGDDYELLFTASPRTKIPHRIAGIPIACIGAMRRTGANRPRVLLVEQINNKRSETPLPPRGWEHYK